MNIDEIEKELRLNAWNKDRDILMAHAMPIIRDIAKRWGIKRVALYGSFLSDKENPSDIDIQIETEPSKKDMLFIDSSERIRISNNSYPYLDIQFASNALFNAQFKFFDKNTRKRYEIKAMVIK
jgi:predicted nucleotidyltransferase